jgi:arylformamidase
MRGKGPAIDAAGNPVRLLVGEHYNHFELPETLGNPHGLLGRAALDLVRLRGETSSNN